MAENFSKVASGWEIQGLLDALLAQPELWNKNPCRLSTRGPHRESQDIFLRYKDETPNIEAGDFSDFSQPHIADWYESIQHLPQAKPLIFDLMTLEHGEMLGGVFIYRLQPGRQIYPHVDKGWHCGYFDKFNICLQSNPKSAFCYADERMVQEAGDVHSFNNNIKHWVINEGETEHIVMIVCLRADRGHRAPWSPEGWTMEKMINQGSI